jgi:hypothetical protein
MTGMRDGVRRMLPAAADGFRLFRYLGLDQRDKHRAHCPLDVACSMQRQPSNLGCECQAEGSRWRGMP